MSKTENFICGECKGISDIRSGKRGSALISTILWSGFIIPGLLYSLWCRRKQPKICNYCGSDFLLPDTASSHKMLQMGIKK